MEPYREYRGWDYTELSEALGIMHDIRPTDDWEPLEWYLAAVLSQVHLHPYPGKMFVVRRAATEIRAFLTKLIDREHDDLAPMWAGMLDIESDFSLVFAFIPNCGNAWG